MKNPAAPVDVEAAFAGYERITMEDYNATMDSTRTAALAHGSQLTYQGTSDLNKTYLDLDVNYNGNVHYSNFMLRFFASDRYKDSYNLSWETADQLIITRYDNAQGFTILDRVKNLAYYGISGPSDWFNVKLKFDITPDASDATKQTVKLQLWLNDKLAWEKTVEETNAASNRNKIFVNANGGTISARVPMDVEDSLKGYTPITLDEYDCNMNIRGEVTIANGGSINYLGDSFDKTYLDVDVNLNGVVGKGSANMRYQSSGKWTDSYALGWNTDGTSLHLFRYSDTSKVVDLATNIPAADYGIASASDALQGIVDYGTPVKAAELAADINNDGKVTQADFDEFVKIRGDVSLAEEIISKYHTASQYYEYLGGKNVMPIGGFYGPYSDETLTDAVYQLIADSGINLITYSGIDAASDASRLQQTLALAEKYGIGVFVNDSAMNTITKDEEGNVTANSTVTSIQELAALMAAYSGYDSFLGINVVDEPKGSSDWGTHSEIADTYYKRYQYYEALAEALLPYANITNYINMHGSQSVDNGKYRDYVDAIGADVDVLSFDTYLYFEDNTYPLLKINRLQSYLESLDTIRQAALDSGKPFWSYVQAGTDYRDDSSDAATVGYYTEADTLWIINTSLAYGAKGIQYFPLLQPTHFSYDSTSETGHDYDRNGIIGANNEANRQYAMVQKANKQIQAIDEVLMNATSTGVVVTGVAKTDISLASIGREHSFSSIVSGTEMLKSVTSGNGGAMVGCFDYQGYEAYYVVNYDRTEGASQNITLNLNSNARYRVIADAVTTSGEGNSIALTVPSGAGVLVVLETLHTHSYGEWTVTTPATLASAGEKQQSCACGDFITEEIPCLANVESWNLTLGGDLAVNFVVDIHEDIADTAKIKITVAGAEYTYDAAEKVSVNVAAAQMNDEITVQIVNGDDASAVKTYTVLQYAQYVLGDESLSNYHQLVKEMLNYGGFAQIYFQYNDENPVNAGVEGVGAEEVPADAAPEMAVSGKVDGISFYGASLLFRNKIAVRYYFTVSGDIGSYTFTVNGVEYQPELKEAGLYYIEVADINPQDLDDAITVAVNETLTVSYSPMNYIVRMSTKGTDNLQALMKAIYNYHLAAEVICPDAE